MNVSIVFEANTMARDHTHNIYGIYGLDTNSCTEVGEDQLVVLPDAVLPVHDLSPRFLYTEEFDTREVFELLPFVLSGRHVSLSRRHSLLEYGTAAVGYVQETHVRNGLPALVSDDDLLSPDGFRNACSAIFHARTLLTQNDHAFLAQQATEHAYTAFNIQTGRLALPLPITEHNQYEVRP